MIIFKNEVTVYFFIFLSNFLQDFLHKVIFTSIKEKHGLTSDELIQRIISLINGKIESLPTLLPFPEIVPYITGNSFMPSSAKIPFFRLLPDKDVNIIYKSNKISVVKLRCKKFEK